MLPLIFRQLIFIRALSTLAGLVTVYLILLSPVNVR